MAQVIVKGPNAAVAEVSMHEDGERIQYVCACGDAWISYSWDDVLAAADIHVDLNCLSGKTPEASAINAMELLAVVRTVAHRLVWCTDAEDSWTAATGLVFRPFQENCCPNCDAMRPEGAASERFVPQDDWPEVVPVGPILRVLAQAYENCRPGCGCCDPDTDRMAGLQEIANVLPGKPDLAAL